eukprot:TRINITY_DN105099_c3_g1_i1.p1 TRINITY_DN105099_c3_g1~~TRINITY_DN105099_c3_g1_i1.p1  ORF type:complete len:617 (+),score=55.95 TRINITY_DN105099_c3_g1_i1:119-1852(+)
MHASRTEVKTPPTASCSRHQGPGFVLKDYTNRAFFPQYTGTSPRRQIPSNINNYDNNILNLSNRRAVSPNGKAIMFTFDSPPPEPKQSVYFTFTNLLQNFFSVCEEPKAQIQELSLMHYTSNQTYDRDLIVKREDFIHRKSKVPFEHPNAGRPQDYKKVVSPFGSVMTSRRSSVQECNAERSNEKLKMAIREKFKEVYESPRQRSKEPSVVHTEEPIEPPIEPKPPKMTPVVKTKSPRVAPIITPTISKPRTTTSSPKHFESRLSNYYNQREALVKAKEELESSIEELRPEISTKPLQRPSKIANYIGVTFSPRTVQPTRLSYRQLSPRMGGASIVDENFGIDHGRVRESEKEVSRSEIRKNILAPVIEAEEQKVALRKDKLYFSCKQRKYRVKPVENPLGLGKYEEVRAKNIEKHRRRLIEQITSDSQRKTAETVSEREIDKLRTECMELQNKKETMEEKARYMQKVHTSRAERENYLLEKQQEKQYKEAVKQEERDYMNETEQKYKEWKEQRDLSQKSIKAQIAAELKSQMKGKAHIEEEYFTTPAKTPVSFLKGMACPHGKMYVCAFCSRGKGR